MFVKLAITAVPFGILAWIIFTFAGIQWGVVFVVTAVILMNFLWFRKRQRTIPSRQTHEQLGTAPAEAATSTEGGSARTMAVLPREPAVAHGLGTSAIADLPVYAYRRSGGGCGHECSVCLGEIQKGEMVKQLPVCTHLFHEGCIDVWLGEHSTCPVCRSRVDAETPVEVAVHIQS